jgi:hypothetical protein
MLHLLLLCSCSLPSGSNAVSLLAKRPQRFRAAHSVSRTLSAIAKGPRSSITMYKMQRRHDKLLPYLSPSRILAYLCPFPQAFRNKTYLATPSYPELPHLTLYPSSSAWSPRTPTSCPTHHHILPPSTSSLTLTEIAVQLRKHHTCELGNVTTVTLRQSACHSA